MKPVKSIYRVVTKICMIAYTYTVREKKKIEWYIFEVYRNMNKFSIKAYTYTNSAYLCLYFSLYFHLYQ